jgi:hypothetical protein
VSEAASPNTNEAKAGTGAEVSTDSTPVPHPGRAPSASACEPYRELIAEALGRGRNAVAIWQDLVDDHGFTARCAKRAPLCRDGSGGHRGRRPAS